MKHQDRRTSETNRIHDLIRKKDYRLAAELLAGLLEKKEIEGGRVTNSVLSRFYELVLRRANLAHSPSPRQPPEPRLDLAQRALAALKKKTIPFVDDPNHYRFVGDTYQQSPPPLGVYWQDWQRKNNTLDIAFIIPGFQKGAGGHMAIFKACRQLETLGHKITFYLNYPHHFANEDEAWLLCYQSFQPLNAQFLNLQEDWLVDHHDVVFATDRWTVDASKRHFKNCIYSYFVQDYEPLFYPAGSDHWIADLTYDDPDFKWFCSSPWLASIGSERGRDVYTFGYPANEEYFYPPSSRSNNQTPLIAFYARSFTPRRAVELGMLALARLASMGFDFEVALFGQDFNESWEWPFKARFMGILTDAEMGELFRNADLGIALSASNYSITSVEMIACGLPLLDIKTPATLATYPPDVVHLAKPNPIHVSNVIVEALAEPDKCKSERINKGLDWTSSHSWQQIAIDISSILLQQCKSSPSTPKTQTLAVTKNPLSVTVCIPTCNGSHKLLEVIEKVKAQKCPYDYDILIIDSGSTDGSIQQILFDDSFLSLHRISKNDFGHGRTRNLAFELSKSHLIAFLTQDAMPARDEWLFSLTAPVYRIPNCAGSYGRHDAYPNSSPYTKHEIKTHFDSLRLKRAVMNKYIDKEGYDRKDPKLLSFLYFFSDNNSCLNRNAWTSHPYPDINFGEDQAWAKNIIEAGFSKIYIDSASVYHSHDYGPEEAYKRARTEAAFYRLELGLDVGCRSVEEAESAIGYLNNVAESIQSTIDASDEELASKKEINAAVCKGRLDSYSDISVLY